MKTIWKYELQIIDSQNVSLPEGAKILSVQVQHGNACLWAEVSPSAPLQRRVINIYGTGHPMDDAERQFIDTIQLEGGQFIFHVYEQL